MPRIDQHVTVSFHYPVQFTQGLFAPENTILRDTVRDDAGRPRQALFVVDQGVADAHPQLIDAIESYCSAHSASVRLASPPLVVPGGERVKNDPAHVAEIHRAVDRHRLDRHAFIIVVGGGAVIDVAGYAAATAHRGVRLVRVPTTVLSQNDSAVGVKNGVNAFGKKNFLGTFAPPFAVLNDSDFLTTLDDRDWLGGVSEAVKVALLQDADFFAYLEDHVRELVARDLPAMRHVVYRCAELHLRHIASSGDPFEFGSSRPLDFGHWAAHKLESLTSYALRHGEAVAIGIALDASYARVSGILSEHEWRRILHLFHDLGLAIYSPELSERLEDAGHPRSVLRGLEEFREHLGGRLTVMLLERIGRGVEVHRMDHDQVRESVALLKAYSDELRGERV